MDHEQKLASLIADMQDRMNRGEFVDLGVWIQRHPEFADEIRGFFDCGAILESALRPMKRPPNHALPAEDERLDLRAFSIRRRLEDIGIGTVHLLVQPSDDPPRELIVLRAWFTPVERNRIERSARFAAGIDCQGARRVLEIGRINQVPYIVREHALGPSLGAVAGAIRSRSGAWTLPMALAAWRESLGVGVHAPAPAEAPFEAAPALVQDVVHLGAIRALFVSFAGILARAHAQGLVHRELTPWSLHVGLDGTAEVQGFGCSWSGSGVTFERMRDWHPEYLAPETLGLSQAPVTWLADIYGFGLCLAAALSISGLAPQAVPLDRDPKEFRDAVVLALPETLPEGWSELVSDCLEPAPESRPPSAEALAERLAALELVAATPRRGWLRRAFHRLFGAVRTGVPLGLVVALEQVGMSWRS